MREAATGQHNGKYTDWAQKILASRAGDSDPIYVRSTWELGGEWFAWTQHANADPEAYKKAWQQFAKAFHEVSPRFKVVWDIVPDRGELERFYPGDQAVDIISQDVYWHSQYDGTDAVKAFEDSVTGQPRGLAWVADFAKQHGKQIAISEWGVPGTGSVDGAKYIELMLPWMKDNNVVYADYWNSTSAYDGLLSDGGPAATAAKLKEALLAGSQGGGTVTPTPNPTPTPPTPTPTPSEPVALTVGSGSDTLVLRISQDAYQGDTQYTVSVDG